MSPASAPQQFTAGALAMVVHLFFFAALVFGVSWKTMPALPVYADLWQALPELAPAPEPEPLPAPEIAPPPPPKPAPPLEKAPAKVDIALKDKEEKRRRQEEEKQRLQAEQRLREETLKEEQRQEELKRREEARQAEEKRLAEEKRQTEEKRKAEEKRQAQERLRKELDKAMAEQMAADLAHERSQLAEAQELAAAAAARDKMILDYRDRIGLKIRGLLRLPPNLKGNPEAVFKVRLLPNGEVLGVTLVKSSGQPAYDQEVERAILKASPLPLPPDREAAATFRENLQLKFRPHEG